MGRKSAAQTPAPKSDRIYGSKTNKAGSASSKKTASSIVLSEKVVKTLKEKADKYNETHSNKVSVNTLKAVFRRGSGAYSKSHRPTITGGVPNSRNAWSFARVNKFLLKKGGTKVKAAYVQDDDLMAKGGLVELLGKIQVYPDGGANVTLWADENNVGFVDIKNDKVENLLYAPSKLEGISKKDYVSNPQYKILTDDLKKYGIKPSDKIHYIEQIEIYEDYRGKGYASQALSDAIDFYKDEGVEFLLLTVGADTSEKGALNNKKLIDFYSRHGFRLLKGSGNYKNRMILDLKEFAKGGKIEEIDMNIPKYLYHSTPSYNRQKIKESGLSSGFDGRIYFTKTLGAASDIAQQLHDTYKKEDEKEGIKFYSIFRIDTSKLKNVNFYKDNDYNAGIYTKEPIPKNAINYYESVKVADIMAKGGKVFNDTELLAKWKRGESIGFTGEAHLKAKGLIPRADGKKRKSEKYLENGGLITNDNIEVKGLNNYTQSKKSGKFYNLFGKRKVNDDTNELWWIRFSRKDGQNTLGYVSYRDENENEKFITLNELPKSLLEIYENPEIKYDEGGLIAPNGKKSNLTPEQYKLVRTPKFKAWFGDWENDPENASKVVDENGEPLVVYHGTKIENFNIFDLDKSKYGFFFTSSYDLAKTYSSNKEFIREYFLDIKKPNKLDFKGANYEGFIQDNKFRIKNVIGYDTKTFASISLKPMGFDGGIMKNVLDYGYLGYNEEIVPSDIFVVFEPNQIKLADGTNITFDANNPDIRFKDGGLNQDVVCVNCGWTWNTADSDESDKYVCHKCGFDNTLFYTDDIMGKLKEPKTLSQIAEIHGVGLKTLEAQLQKGIKEESEHTTDEMVAKTIALHHLEERPDYYDVLEKAMKTKKIALPDTYTTFDGLKPILENQGYDLVEITQKPANGTFEEEFKDGGVVVGKRHSEEDENGTGERFLVESTGQMVEVEGGEGVLCKESMSSDKLYDFEGKKQTGRQIASFLNHKYGGVEFAEGGEVGHVCGCRSKKYYHGGELPSATLQGLSGGEAVVTVKTMESKDLYSFQGKKMTPRQILSKINADSGGKKFEEGGTIDLTKNNLEKHNKLTKMVFFAENILYS